MSIIAVLISIGVGLYHDLSGYRSSVSETAVSIGNTSGRAYITLDCWGEKTPYRKRCYIEFKVGARGYPDSRPRWIAEEITDPNSFLVISEADGERRSMKVSWTGASIKWKEDGLALSIVDDQRDWRRVYIGDHLDRVALLMIVLRVGMISIVVGLVVWILGVPAVAICTHYCLLPRTTARNVDTPSEDCVYPAVPNVAGIARMARRSKDEGRYLLRNWRADVSAIVKSSVYMVESVIPAPRHSPYSIPFGLPDGSASRTSRSQSRKVTRMSFRPIVASSFPILLACFLTATTSSCGPNRDGSSEQKEEVLAPLATDQVMIIEGVPFADLRFGMSLEELKNKLAAAVEQRGLYPIRRNDDLTVYLESYYPPRHLSTEWHLGKRTSCFVALLVGSKDFFIVFVGDQLAKIIEYPDPRWPDPDDESAFAIEYGLPVLVVSLYPTPEEEILICYENEGLSLSELRKLLADLVIRVREAPDLREPVPFLPIVIHKPDTIDPEYRRLIELREKYDASRIRLGMTRERVHRSVGNPLRVKRDRDAGLDIDVFGTGFVLEVPPQVPDLWVYYRDNIVVKVLSRFDDDNDK